MVHQHQCQHGFGNRRGAQADTGVVPSVRGNFHRITVDIDGLARRGNAAGRLDGEIGSNRLPGGNAAQNTARMVGFESLRREFVAVQAAPLRHHIKTVADFHAFHGVDGHQRVGNFRIQAVEHRLAQPDRHVPRLNPQLRTHAVQRFAHAVHIAFQIGNLRLVGGKKRILADKLFAFKRNFVFAHLRDPTHDFRAEIGVQPFFGHRTRRHARRGFPCRTAPAAAIIARAEFVPIGIVGMAGAELPRDIAVIFAALVGVANQQRNRGAGGFPLEHARQNFHFVRLAPLGNMAAGAGFAAVQIGLNIGSRQRQSGRAAVNNAAQPLAVAFAECGYGEYLSDGVACHNVFPFVMGWSDKGAGCFLPFF